MSTKNKGFDSVILEGIQNGKTLEEMGKSVGDGVSKQGMLHMIRRDPLTLRMYTERKFYMMVERYEQAADMVMHNGLTIGEAASIIGVRREHLNRKLLQNQVYLAWSRTIGNTTRGRRQYTKMMGE